MLSSIFSSYLKEEKDNRVRVALRSNQIGIHGYTAIFIMTILQPVKVEKVYARIGLEDLKQSERTDCSSIEGEERPATFSKSGFHIRRVITYFHICIDLPAPKCRRMPE